jgi:hypothetical protein
MVPECPRCERELTTLKVMFRRNDWGGRGPRPRPELWWECSRCGWLGYQRRGGEQLVSMRCLEGTEADCVFCGEDQTNVASDVWEQDDGELRDWVVCLVCGTSNPRRVGNARHNGGQPS